MAGQCVELDGEACTSFHLSQAPWRQQKSSARSFRAVRRSCVLFYLAAFGIVWNNTKERVEKRRSGLLLLFKDEVTELHLVLVQSFRFRKVSFSTEFSGANVKSLIDVLVPEQSHSAINSAYAAIARVYEVHLLDRASHRAPQ
eukprot:6214792-Pleurochrysis_carterae.AAC.2